MLFSGADLFLDCANDQQWPWGNCVASPPANNTLLINGIPLSHVEFAPSSWHWCPHSGRGVWRTRISCGKPEDDKVEELRCRGSERPRPIVAWSGSGTRTRALRWFRDFGRAFLFPKAPLIEGRRGRRIGP